MARVFEWFDRRNLRGEKLDEENYPNQLKPEFQSTKPKKKMFQTSIEIERIRGGSTLNLLPIHAHHTILPIFAKENTGNFVWIRRFHRGKDAVFRYAKKNPKREKTSRATTQPGRRGFLNFSLFLFARKRLRTLNARIFLPSPSEEKASNPMVWIGCCGPPPPLLLKDGGGREGKNQYIFTGKRFLPPLFLSLVLPFKTGLAPKYVWVRRYRLKKFVDFSGIFAINDFLFDYIISKMTNSNENIYKKSSQQCGSYIIFVGPAW